MAYVRVIVMVPEGDEFDAEVDAGVSHQGIEKDLLEALNLSASDGYMLRPIKGEIRKGSILVIDKSKPRAARLLSKR